MHETPGFLLVGLGNPGVAYRETRHNVGFRVLEELMRRHAIDVREDRMIKGLWGEGKVQEKKCVFLFPKTYMNSSGESVRLALSRWGWGAESLCVVCDDVAMPFGRLRIRPAGGSGGHNGLKSIFAHIGTQDFVRLRIGVGNPEQGDLADYVLAPFSAEEKKRLEEVIPRACDALECWIQQGVTEAMQQVNRTHSEEQIGE